MWGIGNQFVVKIYSSRWQIQVADCMVVYLGFVIICFIVKLVGYLAYLADTI